MYNFKRYESQGPSKGSQISINRSGEVTFSSKFCYENKVFSYSYAILFWDKDTRAIGIKFTNNKYETGSYTIRKTNRSGGARVNARGFLNANGIDLTKEAGRFDWKKYEDPSNGMLFVFELNKV